MVGPLVAKTVTIVAQLTTDERYKYVQLERGGERLYDLQNDPYESTNILSSSAEIADRLRVLGHRLKSD
jgi:hypothetical protein